MILKNKLKKAFALFIILASMTGLKLNAQSLQISFDIASTNGGYHISCHGASDGSIESSVTGGTSPYTYVWSNAATTADISGIPAGTYILTVTDANSDSVTDTAIVVQPNSLNISLTAAESFCSYNTSSYGASDGSIATTVTGGVPSYYYTWSSGSHDEDLDDLSAGTYTLTVTDMNGCTSSSSKTLAQPNQLAITSITKSSHGSYNLTCPGGDDGSIEVTVTGGSRPYHYMWTGGPDNINVTDTVGTISDLKAGTYHLYFWACAGGEIDTNITLTAPASISLTTQSLFYNYNTSNVSCNGCTDGVINVAVTGGTPGYTYQWKDTSGTVLSTNDTISNLAVGDYTVTVTDTRGCTKVSDPIKLTSPPSQWALNGNSNIDSTNFIGTKDSKDVVFKTNNSTTLVLKANGKVKIPDLAGSESLVSVDSLGQLKKSPVLVSVCENAPNVIAFQQTPGVPSDVFSCWRRVGIGTIYPQERFEVKGMARFGGYNTTDNYVQIGHTGVDNLGAGGAAQIFNVGNGSLDINSNNGKDVKICTGTSGNVTLGGNNYLADGTNHQVGIGTTNPETGFILDVNGNTKVKKLKITDFATTHVNELLALDVDGNIITSGVNTSNLWQKVSSTNDIYYSIGNVGIGTEVPDVKLMVNGNVSLLSDNNNSNLQLMKVPEGNPANTHPFRRGILIDDDPGGMFDFFIHKLQNNPAFHFNVYDETSSSIKNLMTINPDGNVNICGKILAKEFEVRVGWCDFVFDNDYKRMSFEEQELYFKKNKHLPFIDSGKEIENNGLKMGKAMQGLVQNIEETRLDVVDLYKMITDLKKENDNLQLQINALLNKK